MIEFNSEQWHNLISVAEEYNEAVKRDDNTEMNAMDALITTAEEYKRTMKNQNIIFVGDKEKQNSNGYHPMKTIKIVVTTDFIKTDLY